jgi:DNA-binding MarR family transcriptional regulator
MKGNMKETKPQMDLKALAECGQCTCFNLRKASRIVTQYFDDSMRSIGLRGTQFTLLANAFAYSPITVTRMAEIMVTDRTTLGRNLLPMEKRGLIKVGPGDDRRTRIVQITDAGEKKLEEAYPVWKKTQENIKQKIGSQNWSTMISNISNLVDQMQES